MSTQQKNRTTKAGAAGVALLALVGLGVTAGGIGAYWTAGDSLVAASQSNISALDELLGADGAANGLVFDGLFPGYLNNQTITLTNDTDQDIIVNLTSHVGDAEKNGEVTVPGQNDGDLFANGMTIDVLIADKPTFSYGNAMGGIHGNIPSLSKNNITVPANGALDIKVIVELPYWWDTSQDLAKGDIARLWFDITQVA